MKRYLLFAGETYYPTGGWSDFQKDFDSLADAHAYPLKKHDWAEIVDIEQGHVFSYWHVEKGWVLAEDDYTNS